MNPHDKRRAILQQLRNTLVKVAELDDTISISALITEICREYEVSVLTAKSYIDEMVIMGTAKKKGDSLWHNQELQIKASYFDKKEEEDKKVSQIDSLKTQKEVIQK